MKIQNTFLGGRMNKDFDERLLKNGEYRHAENIKVTSSEDSDAGAVENVLGNKVLTSLSLGANAEAIGVYADNFSNKIYWFVVSDSGSYVCEYDFNTDTPSIILEDTRVSPDNVLNLDKNYLITGVNVVIDSDNGSTFLLWTDNLNPPRAINIERSKTYGANGFEDEDISVIKAPPSDAPTLSLNNTPTNKENNLEERFIRFAYRYEYLDGEKSALSSFTETAFKPKGFEYDYTTSSNESMINSFNLATIGFNTGSSNVKSVDIVYKESGSNAVYMVESFNKSEEGWTDNANVSIDFSNDKTYQVLPEQQLFRLYDAVPLLAKSQELIGNRIVYGNYTSDYDLKDCADNPIDVDFIVSKVSQSISLGTPTESLKSLRDYEIVQVYLDKQGRMTTGLPSKNNTVYIPNSDCINQNQIKVTVPHKAPCFADKFRFFIKQSKYDYDTLVPTLFYRDGLFVWIKLEGNDTSKVQEGDFLYVKSDTRSVLDGTVQTKVLEIKTQDRNFLEDDPNTPETYQIAGRYIKIKPKGFRMNEEDFTNYSFESYDSSSNKNNNPIRGEVNVVEPAVYYGDSGLNDLTEGSPYTGNQDIRYVVRIDAQAIGATGSVDLTGGASGSVDGITVNGVQIMSGAEVFDSDLNQTAINVAANITAHTSTPNYTAVAVGSTVEITSVDKGSASNGFVVVSSTTTITTSDTNMSGGVNDTFQWSDDDESTFTSGVEITGGVQILSNSLEITFGAVVGHLLTDEWVVSAKSKDDDGFGDNESSKAYAFFKSLPSNGNINDDDVIEGGSRILIRYDEYNEFDEFVEEAFTSSSRYANLEEWAFKEDIFTQLGISQSRIWFRRGVIGSVSGSDASYFTQDPTGDMCMIIKSTGTQNNDFDDRVQINSAITIFQSEQNVIFETKEKVNSNDIFYEVGRTYDIDENGNHLGVDVGDINQDFGTTDGEFILPVFNCFAWGNGFESYKIKDSFNATSFKIDTRPTATVDNYRQSVRIASLTYSQVYEQTTNYNGLNEFNLSLAPYKDMDDRYGSIQKLYTKDTDLTVYQEDKVHKVLYLKDVLFDADGQGNIRESSKVLGQEVAYSGEFGISKNPESHAVYGNSEYFTDARRGVLMRKSMAGLEPISRYGMEDWFRDAFRDDPNEFKRGCYDNYDGRYVLNIPTEGVIIFDEGVKGFSTFLTFEPEMMINLYNDFYSFKAGQLYIHNSEDVPHNTFYGVQSPSKVSIILNESPSDVKELLALNLEGSDSWNALISAYVSTVGDEIQSSISSVEFIKKEGMWYAYARRNEDTNHLDSKSTYGIGEILTIDTNTITVMGGSQLLTTGDTILKGDLTTLGNVISQSELDGVTTIELTGVGSAVVGDFVLGMKDARVEGGNLRGYAMRIDLDITKDTKVELFSVNSEVIKSYQ